MTAGRLKSPVQQKWTHNVQIVVDELEPSNAKGLPGRQGIQKWTYNNRLSWKTLCLKHRKKSSWRSFWDGDMRHGETNFTIFGSFWVAVHPRSFTETQALQMTDVAAANVAIAT